MHKRGAERTRRRVTCELLLAGRSYRGIILDLSVTGVFVQTEATPGPGERLRIRFHAAAGGVEFETDASVARRQVAPRELAGLVRGGLGLRVERPPEEYFRLIGMEGTSQSTPRGAGKQVTPNHPAGAADAPAAATPPKPAVPVDLGPQFRIRVKQTDGPRSRTLKMHAGTTAEARKRALAELGIGWEILSIDAV